MEKRTIFLELNWRDYYGILHYVTLDCFDLLPGDKVDCSLKFTFLGDDISVCKNK